MRIHLRSLSLSFVALSTLAVTVALANYFWLKMNQRPPVDDEAYHLLFALKYCEIFGRPPCNLAVLSYVNSFYPPLFPFFAAVTSHVLGFSGLVPLVMCNVFFLVVTFLSLYSIGLNMGDQRLGVLAACLLALYPMFFHLSRMFMLEVALVGVVTLTLALLLQSAEFSRPLWSLLAGVSLGLGVLTKQTYVVFIVGPAVYLLIRRWGDLDRQQKKIRLVNFLLFVLIGIAIAFPWYFVNWKIKLRDIEQVATCKSSVDLFSFPLFSTESLTYYAKVLVRDQMKGLLFGAFLFAFLTKIKKLPSSVFLLLWLVIPYIIFTIFPKKYYYYTLPSLPAIALITAFGFLSIKKTALRVILITVLLLWGAGQYFVLSFLSPQLHSRILRGTRYSPIQKNYHVQTLIKRISEESPVAQPIVGITAIDPNHFLSKTNLQLGENYVFSHLHTLNCMITLESKLWSFEVFDDPRNQGFKTRPDFLVLYDTVEKMGFPAAFGSLYRLTDIFVMPDMSRGYLYKLRDSSPPSEKGVVVHQGDNNADLDNGLLRITLADNAWKIFFKGQEITKEFSIYTLIESSGKWIDSRLCGWELLALSKNRIAARAFFSFLLPVQDWEFVLDGDRLYWTVKIFTPFFAKLEWEQASIMLSDTYQRWRTSREAGDFPPTFYKEQDGDWPSMTTFIASGSEFVGVERFGDAFPTIAFYALDPRPGLKGQIINSDNNYRGRILQYSVKHAPELFLWPWKAEYFRGCIIVKDTEPQAGAAS